MKHYCETWAIAYDRIYSFFRQMEDIQYIEKSFCFSKCKIQLTALAPRNLGPVSVPQTRVEISGPEREAQEIHHRFVMQFLSAGG